MKRGYITNSIGLLCQKHFEKYSDMWFLRELDYRPQSLASYLMHWKPSKDTFEYAVNTGMFRLFNTREEAQIASEQVRLLLGLKA